MVIAIKLLSIHYYLQGNPTFEKVNVFTDHVKEIREFRIYLNCTMPTEHIVVDYAMVFVQIRCVLRFLDKVFF